MRELTLQDLVEAGHQAEQWTMTYPGGYKTRFQVVRPRHPALKDSAGGFCDGMAYDFGDPVPPSDKLLPDREAKIFFSRAMSIDRFMHCLFHEIYHNLTEWTGRKHIELLESRGKLTIELMEDEEE